MEMNWTLEMSWKLEMSLDVFKIQCNPLVMRLLSAINRLKQHIGVTFI